MHTFDLTLDDIAKIEGKASLSVRVVDDHVEECTFKITEFKRFYTQALRGKDVVTLPQVSCRICGTCSNAHLLCAIKAAEHALGIVPSQQTVLLRQLVNFGLVIRDHALHCYVFALPDLLGVDSILDLDDHDPEQRQILEDTFMVKAAGNTLGTTIGGRSVHAPFPMVGGFAKLPDPSEFPKLVARLAAARPAVLRLIDRFSKQSAVLERDTMFGASLDDHYSFLGGEIHDTSGAAYPPEQFGDHLSHTTIPNSHASGYRYNGQTVMVGALARLNLGKDRLHQRTTSDAADALSRFPSRNIFHNNLAQALEILHAIDSSLDILRSVQVAPEPLVRIVKKAGEGIGVIEAPRGTLLYRVTLDEKGIITNIQIVVPTGLNQVGIGESLFAYLHDHVDRGKDELTAGCEQIIRAFDPCMSCASHFLTIQWMTGQRRGRKGSSFGSRSSGYRRSSVSPVSQAF